MKVIIITIININMNNAAFEDVPASGLTRARRLPAKEVGCGIAHSTLRGGTVGFFDIVGGDAP
jgi:hypothetical protein